jgi:AcrR family transcriptional regulator
MSPRDPEATKARIFDAATAEFAAYGIAGARIDRIAQQAHANKQLIYAYFGDKKQLFYRVLERALTEVAASVSTDITDVDRWTDEHIDYYREHPELLRLLLWEALEVDPADVPRSEARAGRYRHKLEKISEAQQQGLVRRDMPRPYVMMLLMSLVHYPEAVPQCRELLFGDEYDPEQMRAWTREAVRCVISPTGPEARREHDSERELERVPAAEPTKSA